MATYGNGSGDDGDGLPVDKTALVPISPKEKIVPVPVEANPALVPQEGQAFQNAVSIQVESIMSFFFGVLPSNYVSSVKGPFYTMQFQAAAEEIARIQVCASEILSDYDLDFTRPEFLYQILGAMVFPDAIKEGTVSIEGDIQHREFIRNMIQVLLKGATPEAVRDGISLLTDATLEIIEKSIAMRETKGSVYTLDDQFEFELTLSKILQTSSNGTHDHYHTVNLNKVGDGKTVQTVYVGTEGEPHVHDIYSYVVQPSTGQLSMTFTVTLPGGYTDGYYLNEAQRSNLHLVKGETYRFDQSGGTNEKFPMTLKTSPGAPTNYVDGVVWYIEGKPVSEQIYYANFNTSASRYFELTVPEAVPATLFYLFEGVPGMGATIMSFGYGTVGHDHLLISQFPEADPIALARNVELVLKALKPAHTLYQYRNLFRDIFGTLFSDSMTMEYRDSRYDDFRKFCLGAKHIVSSGETLTDRSLFSDTSVSFHSIKAGSDLVILSGPNAVGAAASDVGTYGRFRVSDVLVFPVSDESVVSFITSPTGRTGKLKILWPDVVTAVKFDLATNSYPEDESFDFDGILEGELLEITEGANKGTYRISDLLGERGGPLPYGSGPSHKVRLAPCLLRLDKRMRNTSVNQDYELGVDRLGVRTPQVVVGEDASEFFLL